MCLTSTTWLREVTFIISDSGGVQEEAPSLGKPVLVLRDTTERPEGVKAGTLKLVGTDPAVVKSTMTELLTNEHLYLEMAKCPKSLWRWKSF